MTTPRRSSSPNHRAKRNMRLQRWLDAFAPLRELGRLFDAPAFVREHRQCFSGRPDLTVAHTRGPRLRRLPLTRFLEAAHALLATDDESARGQLERRLLKLARSLHAAGVFELMQVRHPAMQRMIDDHLVDHRNTPRPVHARQAR